MKLTVEEQKELISDESIYRAFLERDDVKKMSPEEVEVAWTEQLKGIERFRNFLSGLDSIIVMPIKK